MKKILKILNNNIILQILIANIVVFTILGLIVDNETKKMYEVQAYIVKHDYGHIYKDINDWKLEQIEKYERENKKWNKHISL